VETFKIFSQVWNNSNTRLSMRQETKTFELQIDLKPNGAVIRLNGENGCILRICGIPLKMVVDSNGEIKEYIDITYPK
jgi:hypothetical protein